jgi:hypothetical protein
VHSAGQNPFHTITHPAMLSVITGNIPPDNPPARFHCLTLQRTLLLCGKDSVIAFHKRILFPVLSLFLHNNYDEGKTIPGVFI